MDSRDEIGSRHRSRTSAFAKSPARLPGAVPAYTVGFMKLQDIEREALVLSESDRAALVLSLMETLATPDIDVDDEGVLQRDAEMESGAVPEVSHEEFVRGIERERRG